jgi:polar amino acid transport system ATP-binding protein
VVIIGPSGSGKTTLLRCINHLERIDDGLLYVNGHLIGYRVNAKGQLVNCPEAEIARQRQEIGFVFQHFNLFPHLTALENVTLAPVRVRGTTRADAVAEGRRLLSRVGWRTSPTPTRGGSPAASSSGWRSPARSR